MQNAALVVGFERTHTRERRLSELFNGLPVVRCGWLDDISTLNPRCDPALILLNFSTIGDDPIERARTLYSPFGNHVVRAALSRYADDCCRALAAGAICFLLDEDPIESQRKQLDAARRGEMSLSTGSATALLASIRELSPPPLRLNAPLSGREAELLQLLAGGAPIRACAARLGITYNTAVTYARRLYGKLGISSRGELIRVSNRLALDGRLTGYGQ